MAGAPGSRNRSLGSQRERNASIWTSHAVLVIVQFGYGGAYILSKFALTAGIHPVVLGVYRDIIAIFFLVPFAYFVERGQRSPVDFKTLALFMLLGVVGVFASQLLLLVGLSLATAALSSVISITIPIMVFIISAVFGLEEINWKGLDGQAKVGGVISAVTGAVLIPLYRGPVVLGTALQDVHAGHLSEFHMESNGSLTPTMLSYFSKEPWQIGVIMFFLSGLSLAIYISLQVPTLKRYPAPISLTAFAYIFGALMLATTGLLTIQNRSEWVIHQPSALGSILYLGLIPSAVNSALQTWAIVRTGPVLLAAYCPLQTIITSFLAHLLLGESIHLGSLLGTLLIVNGLFFITFGRFGSQKAALDPVNVVSTPDALPIIQGPSKLEEPLLG